MTAKVRIRKKRPEPKHRMTLEMSAAVKADLGRLRELNGAASDAEAIRRAIKTALILAEQAELGYRQLEVTTLEGKRLTLLLL